MKRIGYKTALEILCNGGTMKRCWQTESYTILDSCGTTVGFITFDCAMKLHKNNNLLLVSKVYEMTEKYKLAV